MPVGCLRGCEWLLLGVLAVRTRESCYLCYGNRALLELLLRLWVQCCGDSWGTEDSCCLGVANWSGCSQYYLMCFRNFLMVLRHPHFNCSEDHTDIILEVFVWWNSRHFDVINSDCEHSLLQTSRIVRLSFLKLLQLRGIPHLENYLFCLTLT